MLVYRRREPDNSSKIARRYNQKPWVGTFLFLLEHRRFRFLPCLREQLGKQSSARSPSSKYRRSYGKHNNIFLTLFRISALHFLLVTMNTRSKTDKKERRRCCGRRIQEVCRESRPYFFRISYSYNVFVLLPFQFEIKQSAILSPWKLFLSNELRSFCTRLFLFRFINRNRNTAQKEYALRLQVSQLIPNFGIKNDLAVKSSTLPWDSCDVTHSLTQASIHTSHVHDSKCCTKYSLHFVQSTSRHSLAESRLSVAPQRTLSCYMYTPTPFSFSFRLSKVHICLSLLSWPSSFGSMHAHLFFHIHILLAYPRTRTLSHVPPSHMHAHMIQCYCRCKVFFLFCLC